MDDLMDCQLWKLKFHSQITCCLLVYTKAICVTCCQGTEVWVSKIENDSK